MTAPFAAAPGPNGVDEQYAAREAKGEEPWCEPLDIIGSPELTGWPVLTPDCFPAPLLRYVSWDALRLNVDPVALATHVIAACSSSISEAWQVKPKKRDDRFLQHARVWTCVVKDVGARGTDMLRSAYWPLKARNTEFYEEWQRKPAEWTKRHEERKKKKDPDDPEPQCRQLITNDATIEAASDILSKAGSHSKITVLCDELAMFFGSFARYNSKNGASIRSHWLEGYDGGPHHINRIVRGHIFVPSWSAVVAGNIQPRKLAGMAKDLIEDGLFQRFLTVHMRPPAMGIDDDDPPLPVDLGHDYRSLHLVLGELMPCEGAEKGRPSKPAYFDDDAQVERKRLKRLIERLQVDTSLPVIIRETAAKWSGLMPRLALIFHLVQLAERVRRGETPTARELHCVAVGTVAMAAEFLRKIALPNLFRLGFETMPEEGAPHANARWIAGHILARRVESLTTRDIGRVYNALRGKTPETAAAMEVLIDAGWARRLREARVDSLAWEVNPAVHTAFAATAAEERARRERAVQLVRENVATL